MPDFPNITQLLNGSVFVEDGVNPTPEIYGTARRVNVTIAFAMADGDTNGDAIVSRASQVAAAQVDILLGRAAGAVTVTPPKTRRPPATPTTETPNVPDAPAIPGGSASPAGLVPPDSGGAGPAADVPDVPGPSDIPEPSDSLADMLGEEQEPEPITDAELVSAIVRANERLKDTPRIRKLIADFNPVGEKQPKAALVPANERAAFLAAMDELK